MNTFRHPPVSSCSELRDPTAGRLAPDAVRVLSVQSSNMGHRTYAQSLREGLAASTRVRFDSVWLDQNREAAVRIACKVGALKVPSSWVGQRNLDFRRVRSELGYAAFGLRLVQREVQRRGAPDVLHFHTQVASLLSARWMREIPSVVSADMVAAQVAEEQPSSAYNWTYWPGAVAEKRAFRAATHCVFWSEWTRRRARSDYEIAEDATSVIPPSAPAALFGLPDRQGASTRPRLLFVGNDLERKGGLDLLAVFREELRGRADLHLVTNAPVEPAEGIYVHAGVSAGSDAWLRLYAAADVFVLPTRREAFGLAFVEALAAGLPVIGSDLNAIPEIVGEAGFLVPPGDRSALAEAVKALLDDSALRARLGKQGRRRAAEHFDGGKNIGRLEDLFWNIGAGRRRAEGTA